MSWPGERHAPTESSTAGDRVHLGVPRTKSRSQRSSQDSKSLLHLHISQLVLRHRDSVPALVESPESSAIDSYFSEYSTGADRVDAKDQIGGEDFSDSDLRHSHCPLRRKSSLPVRFLGVGTTPSVVISDFSCSKAVDSISLDMLKDEWQRRLSSASSVSTISSFGGFDRSRRGSLLDLDAEGLVMSGDGRLERADYQDLICSPELLLDNLQQEHASDPPDIAEDFPKFDFNQIPSCNDYQNLLRSDDVQDTSEYTDRRLSLESDACLYQRAEENCWSGTHVRYSIASPNQSLLRRRSVSLEQMSTLRDVRASPQCTATKASQWKKVRSVVQWTPFVQTYKKQKYPWIQLAGHQGNFRPSSGGAILKKLCGRERICLQQIMSESLKPFVPEYRQTIIEDDKEFLQMQDLLGEFRDPCVMDCKMGVRTYLEEELAKAREKPKLRKDMYEKMLSIDKAAPTEEEHRLGAVTKPRYMVWRETISSTATLGFRIEGIRRNDGFSSKDFKTTRTREQVAEAVSKFTAGYANAVSQYLDRLRKIKTALLESPFFRSHELIGSSLLFVHDSSRADVWLIDFAKTTPLPNDVKIDHDKVWQPGNHEDGYLLGVDNLISILSSIASDNTT